MKYLWLAMVVVMGFGGWGRGDEVYRVRKLSEGDLMGMYREMLVEACRHGEGEWKKAPFDAQAGYWGDGVSDGNEGIRAVGEMVLACGTLVKYREGLSDEEVGNYRGKMLAAIRYAAATHVTGNQKCVDGKKWGGSWQSAMWTATMGFGAWLNWDELDAGMRKDVERVVGWEADRFLKGRPPGGVWGDTKAEENGWNLICIALAANLFPGNAHAAAWQEKGREYMMNTLSSPGDLTDGTVVDGKAVKDWVTGANVHGDFTLENHGFFHPSYVGCSSYFLTQTAMYYRYAGKDVPVEARHHLMETWVMLQGILLPGGEAVYPQGMDWEVHGLSFINLFASLSTWQKDVLAARMEEKCLQYMRAWQVMGKGDLTVPGSRLGFTRHAIIAEQTAYGYLAHKIFGEGVKEMGEAEAEKQVEGVREYGDVGIVMQRTGAKWVSFSWKNRVMGMVVPIGEGHEGEPFFGVPMARGLIGSMELEGVKDDGKVKVVEDSFHKVGDGFETEGVVLTNGGRLRQAIKVNSIGEKAVVYQDRVVAQEDVAVTKEMGMTVGIENDPVSGGRRAVRDEGGEEGFEWGKTRKEAGIAGTWANVDGRLAMVMVEGAGMGYVQGKGYDGRMALGTDVLCGSYGEGVRRFKKGEEVARRVGVILVEVSAEETERLARSVRVEEAGGKRVVRFELPEGGEGVVEVE